MAPYCYSMDYLKSLIYLFYFLKCIFQRNSLQDKLAETEVGVLISVQEGKSNEADLRMYVEDRKTIH